MPAKHHLREGDLLKRSFLSKADPYRSQFSACPINAGHGGCVTGKGAQVSAGQQFPRLLVGGVEHFHFLDEVGEEPALHLYLDRNNPDGVVLLEALILL